MDVVRRAAIVTGRVQGVSFRYYTSQRADRLGLTGWVRNAEDGSVQLEVQGSREAVESLLDWVRTGPPQAAVADVDIQEREPRAGEDRFRVTR